MLLWLPLIGMAHAAVSTKLRYFEGELLIEKAGGHEDCQRQVGKTRKVQISWQETRKDGAGSIVGWIVFAGGAPGKLAGQLLAKRTDEAMATIERATRLEGKVKDLDLYERLLRLRLTGNIYSAAQLLDQAQAVWQEEIKLATTQAGPDDLRTFEARAHSVQVFLAMKDNARFEADFEPLAKDISSRFGETSELARENNELIGMHYYNIDATAKARPWLERAFRGHREQFDSTVQAIREDEDAKNILAALLDIYIKQGLVPKDFLDQIKDGQASLDDLPFQRPLLGELNLPIFNLNPGPRDMLPKR